jgi:hypothetical protein
MIRAGFEPAIVVFGIRSRITPRGLYLRKWSAVAYAGPCIISVTFLADFPYPQREVTRMCLRYFAEVETPSI